MIVAGIMSGTSLDGIDVAVVDIGKGIRPIAHKTVPYPKPLKEAILAVSNNQCHTSQISRLNFQLAELYAKALGDWVRRYKVKLIGCHGQTVYHEGSGPKASTMQLGDGSVLAQRAGVPVVSDFRPRDMAAGGKGAPLVPFLDYKLFRDRRRGRVALNIGGIANLTAIPPAAKPEDVLAFDTGPGNMLIDGLVRHFTQGRRQFDPDGRIASRGHLMRYLHDQLIEAPFYKAKPPKTAGREQYGKEFITRLLETKFSFANLVATATVLTASTIVLAIERFVRPRMPVHDLIISGGGIHNQQILFHLAALLPKVNIQSSAAYGVDPDAKEAVAFALLAYESFRKRPSNLPSATGARKPVILGKLSL
ncbi:MAG: anhydro-N-acetylmuramic acid kinase [Acidimicrobiia bacterium]|nr:anhydro-N-acetylmuramic acid kinase [Acidimicrobiia bacterium]